MAGTPQSQPSLTKNETLSLTESSVVATLAAMASNFSRSPTRHRSMTQRGAAQRLLDDPEARVGFVVKAGNDDAAIRTDARPLNRAGEQVRSEQERIHSVGAARNGIEQGAALAGVGDPDAFRVRVEL